MYYSYYNNHIKNTGIYFGNFDKSHIKNMCKLFPVIYMYKIYDDKSGIIQPFIWAYPDRGHLSTNIPIKISHQDYELCDILYRKIGEPVSYLTDIRYSWFLSWIKDLNIRNLIKFKYGIKHD